MYNLATETWDSAEISSIHQTMKNNRYTMGPMVEEFERKFAEYNNTMYSVMVNSGSSANLLMIAALIYSGRIKRGDEVIVTSVSWSTTYFPLEQFGLKVKFVDVDLDTLNADVNAIRSAVTENTKLILLVNLLGNPNLYTQLPEGVIVIEDNCESLGAKYRGKMAGSFGVMGSYSTFFSHHISTMEGGLVCTNDVILRDYMLAIRSHGWTRHLSDDNHLTRKSTNPFEESFRFIVPGFNLRPVEMSGAIGVAQMEKLPNLIKERRKNAVRFSDMMDSFPQIKTQQEVGESSWFGFSMIFDSPAGRARAVKVFQERGIECRPIVAGNFTKNPVVRDWFDYEIHGTLTNANVVDTNGLFIGNHHYNISEGLVEVRQALKEVFR